jgi:predicted RNA-binding Zn-ribbon protein involved in translation (DUF1610 family)
MSYEGYSQCICKCGYYYEVDAADSDYNCPKCGQMYAWCNSVDETNYNDDGIVPWDILQSRFLKYGKIPTCEETKYLRKPSPYMQAYGGDEWDDLDEIEPSE